MPKIVNTAVKAKAWTFEAKAIKFGLEAPRGQGLASRTTSLPIRTPTRFNTTATKSGMVGIGEACL